MSRKIKEIVITAIVTLVIVVLIGSFIKDYLTLPKPIFYLEVSCYEDFNDFNKNNFQSFSVAKVTNRGDVAGLAKVCVSSQEFVFKAINGESLHELCWTERDISPKQAELETNYYLEAKPDTNTFSSIENATIKISVSCNQKIWSLVSRSCSEVVKTCRYKKEGDYLRKIT